MDQDAESAITNSVNDTPKMKIKLKRPLKNVEDSQRKRRSEITYHRPLLKLEVKRFSSTSIEERKEILEYSKQDEFDNLVMMSDALMAIHSLLQSGEHAVVGTHNIPIVLRHMVQNIFVQQQHQKNNDMHEDVDLGASTIMTTELKALVEQNQIRQINLMSTNRKCGQDVALVLMQSYLNEVHRLLHQINVRDDGTDLAQRFMHVLDKVKTSQVSDTEIMVLLNTSNAQLLHVRKDVDTLTKLGFIVKNRENIAMLSISENIGYQLSLPGIGAACKSVADGRTELIRRIRCSRFSEIKLTTLAQKNLKRSDFSTMFHIKDLCSTGQLKIINLPAGDFVKLA